LQNKQQNFNNEHLKIYLTNGTTFVLTFCNGDDQTKTAVVFFLYICKSALTASGSVRLQGLNDTPFV